MSYTQPGNFSNTGAPMGERSPVGLDSWFNGLTDLHSSPRDVLHLPAAGAPPSPIGWERAGARGRVAVAYPTVSAISSAGVAEQTGRQPLKLRFMGQLASDSNEESEPQFQASKRDSMPQ